MRRNRMKVFWLILLCFGAFAAGCSLPAASGTSDIVPPDPNDPSTWDLPVAAAIADAAGYTEAEVVEAVDRSRFEHIVDCMQTDGWDYSLADLPSFEPPTVSSLTGDQAEYHLRLLDQLENSTPDEEPAPQRSVEFESARLKCWDSAERAFPDPTTALASWIHEETEELEHRIAQDARVVQAHEEAIACLAATGHVIPSGDSVSDEFAVRSAAVWEEYMRGSIDADATRSVLLTIAAEERAYNEAAIECLAPEAETQWLVRAEYEMEYLASNGDRIALVASEYRAELRRFRGSLEP